MWNGTPRCRTLSAAVSAALKGPTLVKPPSLVACMWAKSITGRTQSKCRQMATMSSRLPSSWTRPITSTPKSTARPLVARRCRNSVSCATTAVSASSRDRPSKKPGWMTIGAAPHAGAKPPYVKRGQRRGVTAKAELRHYINLHDQAREAMASYQKVLRGNVDLRAATQQDASQPAGPGHRMMHAQLEADGAPRPGQTR